MQNAMKYHNLIKNDSQETSGEQGNGRSTCPLPKALQHPLYKRRSVTGVMFWSPALDDEP